MELDIKSEIMNFESTLTIKDKKTLHKKEEKTSKYLRIYYLSYATVPLIIFILNGILPIFGDRMTLTSVFYFFTGIISGVSGLYYFSLPVMKLDVITNRKLRELVAKEKDEDNADTMEMKNTTKLGVIAVTLLILMFLSLILWGIFVYLAQFANLNDTYYQIAYLSAFFWLFLFFLLLFVSLSLERKNYSERIDKIQQFKYESAPDTLIREMKTTYKKRLNICITLLIIGLQFVSLGYVIVFAEETRKIMILGIGLCSIGILVSLFVFVYTFYLFFNSLKSKEQKKNEESLPDENIEEPVMSNNRK